MKSRFLEVRPLRRGKRGLRRRDRFPDFVGARGDAGQVLDRLCVVMVGCGAVGRRAALHLARAGVGEIRLVDPKSYSRPECIQTQPITPDEVGGGKAELTARACREISPGTRVLYFAGTLQELWLSELLGADVVLMATDNLVGESETGQRCLHLGVPLIHAAVHGETMVVQVRLFANRGADSPTPACLFSRQEREFMRAQVEFSCDGTPAHRARAAVSAPPTMSTSSLCSLAADIAVNQLLRLVLGLGEPVDDSMVEYCAYTHRSHVTDLARREGCPCDHSRFRVLPAPGPLADCPVDALVDLAGRPAAGEVVELSVGDRLWAEAGICASCAGPRAVNRFVDPASDHAGRCDRCGEPLRCQPFHQHRPVALHLLGSAAGRPLRELGAVEVPWVLVRHDGEGVLITNPKETDEQS